MSNSFIQSQYDLWHEQMAANEQNDVLSLPWYKTVAKSLPDLNGKSIIEVGCGRGVFSNYLANKYPGAKITAIDFSESAITIAKNNFFNVPNLHFEVGDAESLVFKEDQFDFYNSCETLEHVFQPQKMIREAKRILVQGGHFVITTENYFNAYLLVWLKCWLLRKPFASGCGIQPNENFFIEVHPAMLHYGVSEQEIVERIKRHYSDVKFYPLNRETGIHKIIQRYIPRPLRSFNILEN